MPPQQRSSLLGVKWRFLSADIANASLVSPDEMEAPFSDEAQRRITYLERALASSHDLDSQYQTFLQEAGKHAGGGGALGQSRALGAGPRSSELADGVDLLTDGQTGSADFIPSDPFDAQPVMGARAARSNPRGAPPSARLEGVGMDGGSGMPGSSHAADDEVRKVQARAAASGDGEAAVDAPDRNSPSPVIIWRHAAPVRLANNVPMDLLPPSQKASAGRRRSPRAAAEPGFGATSEAPAVSPRAAERAKRMAYGAWYLPVNTWATSTVGSAHAAAPDMARGAAGGGAAGGGAAGEAGEGGAADGAERNSMELLPKLYSSRIYKEYLKAQHIHRIPHYLAHVESPKQLPARRASISLLDSGGSPGGAAAGDASP